MSPSVVTVVWKRLCCRGDVEHRKIPTQETDAEGEGIRAGHYNDCRTLYGRTEPPKRKEPIFLRRLLMHPSIDPERQVINAEVGWVSRKVELGQIGSHHVSQLAMVDIVAKEVTIDVVASR